MVWVVTVKFETYIYVYFSTSNAIFVTADKQSNDANSYD